MPRPQTDLLPTVLAALALAPSVLGAAALLACGLMGDAAARQAPDAALSSPLAQR